MPTKKTRKLNYAFVLTALTLTQMASDAVGQEEAGEDELLFELSPFIVESDNRGYVESNAVSGTSLKMAIRDLPMSLEVINNKFITDQQATDLKEALAYSAGVFTRSYVDGSGANEGGSAERSPSTVASVNNPFTNTVSIRGFAVPNQQRFGFRVGGVADGSCTRARRAALWGECPVRGGKRHPEAAPW